MSEVIGGSPSGLGSGYVRYPWYAVVYLVIRRILKYVLICALVAFATYMMAVVPSVARYIYVDGPGYVYTRTPQTDRLKPGTRVVFDAGKTTTDSSDVDSLLGRLELATIPPAGVSVGVIEAGPDGQLLRSTTDPNGGITVNGVATTLDSQTADGNNLVGRYLSNEYVMACKSGPCARQHDRTIIAPAKSVEGVVLTHPAGEGR